MNIHNIKHNIYLFIAKFVVYSPSHFRGLLIVATLIFLCLHLGALEYIIPTLRDDTISKSKFLVDSLTSFNEEKDTHTYNYISKEETKKGYTHSQAFSKDINPFLDSNLIIDLNSATFESLRALNFTEKEANTVLNYLAKNGKFYSKEDIIKMFFMTEERFYKIEKQLTVVEDKPYTNYVDINYAQPYQLVSVLGIDLNLARKIFFYKSSLGGIYDIYQLESLVIPELFKTIIKKIRVNSARIRKIDINFVSLKNLSEHPYIGVKVATEMLNHRKERGNFTSLEEIKKMYLSDTLMYQRVLPYISLKPRE